MNDLSPAGTGTALALPESAALAAMFAQPGQVDDLISRIKAEARSHAPDLTTKKGRDAIKSLAHTVARSKTALDAAGKSLTDEARKQIAAVDAERRKIRDELDALKAEIRQPLDDWEAAEEKRVADIKHMLGNFDMGRADAQSDSAHIRHVIADIEALPTGADVWAEYLEIAQAKREATLSHFRNLLVAAEQREADTAELARLRAEAEERARKDAEEAAAKAEAERVAAEAAERERRAAEQGERDRVAAEEAKKREAERQAQIERDKAAAAERAQKEAEERAAREAKEAADRHARELAEAKAREEAAAQAERDRIAAAQKAEREAAEKRRADAEHANRVKTSIRDALVTFTAPYGDEDMELAADIATAIFEGKIPNVEVRV